MTRWADRPTEVANLLNPAFCGRLLIECAEQYGRPLPFEFAVLVLPIVLHRDTRTKLPRSIATSMQTWIERNPEVRVGFAERVRDLAPFTREALRFSLAHAQLRFRPEAGAFEPEQRGSRRGRRAKGPDTAEVRDCLVAAGLIGRWFAVSTPSAIYSLWGIRP